MWRSRPRRSEPAADRRSGTRTVDDNETHCSAGKSSLGPKTSMETSPAPRSETLLGRTACWTTLWFWRRGANAARKPTNAFSHPGVVISNTLTTVWISFRGSVVKCARSQVHTNTSRNTSETWEKGYYMKATSRTRTSLDKMSLQ